VKLVNGTREFKLVKSTCPGNRLPKRVSSSVALIVNGVPFSAPVTSNAAWSAFPEKTLEYVWVERAGVAYYATLDYAEKAADWVGAEVTIADGVATREDPIRETAAKTREAERVAKFKTWVANRGMDSVEA
jgi:hypothetical protein